MKKKDFIEFQYEVNALSYHLFLNKNSIKHFIYKEKNHFIISKKELNLPTHSFNYKNPQKHSDNDLI